MSGAAPAPFAIPHSRLILSMDGLVLREILLDREQITVGRKPYNEVCIDDLSISGEHLRITTIFGDAFLEDLDSTNGTYVNDKPVTRRVLAPNDVISLGKYRLRYIVPPERLQSARTGSDRSADENEPNEEAAKSSAQGFYLRVLNGSYAGRLIALDKSRSVFRARGVVVAVLRRHNGYVLTPLEGPPPIVDGQLTEEEVMLVEKAKIDLAGVTLEFVRKT